MRKIYISVIALFSIVVSTSFQTPGGNQDSLKYQPTDNFDWLKEYFVFSKTVTVEGWTGHPQLTFDSTGVVQVGVEKNPCTISEYALALYNRYLATKDEKFLQTFMAQVKWLINPANYELLDHDMLGHSYKYQFHDLTPPWYGGLAEAEFISVLIRYYSLTKDESVLPIIIKTRNLLLTPEANGGLLSKTPEGNTWIEEYGKSKQERHVLNGFFVTVISLYEYCQMFPEDKEARVVLNDCYESIKKSLKFYERNNWVTYNRGDFRLVINWYMKAQVIELEELYRVSKDDFFKYQKMLWSTYVYEKPIGRPPGTCLIENYNFSVPGILENGNITPMLSYPDIVPAIALSNIKASEGVKMDSVQFIKDGNINNWLELNCNDSSKSSSFNFDYTFSNDLTFDKLSFVSNHPELLSKSVKFLYTDEKDKQWKELKPTKFQVSGNIAYFTIDKVSANALRLEIKRGLFNKAVKINELRLHNSSDYQAPEFSHYTTGLYQTKSGSINLSFEGNFIMDPIVYYKSVPEQGSMNSQIWTQEKSFRGNNLKINSTTDHFYQFLVIYKIKSATSHLSAFSVK